MKYNFSMDEKGRYVNVCFGNLSIGIISPSHTFNKVARRVEFSFWDDVEFSLDEAELWEAFDSWWENVV